MLPQAAASRHAPVRSPGAMLRCSGEHAAVLAAGAASRGDRSMADSRQLRRLAAYNQWADERILATIDGISAEELARPREAYFGTIAANLRHTLTAQRIW